MRHRRDEWGTQFYGWCELGHGGGVDAGVLADVERLQMQAVGAGFEEQRIDQQSCEARAACCRRGSGGVWQYPREALLLACTARAVWRWRVSRTATQSETAEECALPPRRIMMQAMNSRTDSCGKRSTRRSSGELGPAARSVVQVLVQALFDSLAETGTCLVELASCSKTFCRRRQVVVRRGDRRDMASASVVVEGVTKGLPSRSPPIQEPKVTSSGRSASSGDFGGGVVVLRTRGRGGPRRRARAACRRARTRSSRAPCGSRRAPWDARRGRRRSARAR